MKTFKQYMAEVFNTAYPYKKLKKPDWSQTHQYRVKDHRGNNLEVNIQHGDDDKRGYIDFQDSSGSYKSTGEYGKHATGVISRVLHVAREHAKRHPSLQSISFTSEKTGSDASGARDRLYSAITRRHGGTTRQFEDHSVHTIPVNNGIDTGPDPQTVPKKGKK